MRCPYCQHEELKVTDSRDAPEMNATRRRRECLNCQRRFTTFETIELTVQVLKRDGRYEDFQQQKLVNGLLASCRHTTISHQQVIEIAAKVTEKLLSSQLKDISTKEIGEIVMQHLHALDPIAYIRFACEYRRFKEISELMDAIKSVSNEEATCGLEKS